MIIEKRGDERGAALVLVLVALTIVAGLAGAAFLTALAQERAGRSYLDHLHAFAAAEAGVYRPVWSWDTKAYNTLPIDGATPFEGRLADGTGSYRGTLRRLSQLLFVVTAEGSDEGSQAQVRLGLLLRLGPLPIHPAAALTVRGAVSIDDASLVTGRDRPPPGWDCQPPESDVPALRIHPQDSAAVTVSCPTPPCLIGDPPILLDDLVTLPNLTTFAGMELTALQQLANHSISGSVSPLPRSRGATCVTAVADNWGDPYGIEGSCGDYRPLIYAAGDLEVRGGRGQGTLVVAGDLTIGGGFAFSGLVLVRGTLAIGGTGNQLMGALIVANADLGRNSIAGGTMIEYSSCAVRRAQIGAGTAAVVRHHSWFHAY
ncbi:MAG: hypothetical protein JSW71_23415 [Gemmatimonadota bacterium]|nr:MAG: hypothetical protein JSW71_23415 [Gemmatimonadota bacterium]